MRLFCISIDLPYGILCTYYEYHTMHGILFYFWAGASSCSLEFLDKLQKRICRSVGPSLAASLKPLAHRQNVASFSLFYRYFFGRCLSELSQLVPLPYSRGRSTHYSDRLHDFLSPFQQFLSSHSKALEFSAYTMLSLDL